jgi:hypothetical protein
MIAKELRKLMKNYQLLKLGYFDSSDLLVCFFFFFFFFFCISCDFDELIPAIIKIDSNCIQYYDNKELKNNYSIKRQFCETNCKTLITKVFAISDYPENKLIFIEHKIIYISMAIVAIIQIIGDFYGIYCLISYRIWTKAEEDIIYFKIDGILNIQTKLFVCLNH